MVRDVGGKVWEGMSERVNRVGGRVEEVGEGKSEVKSKRGSRVGEDGNSGKKEVREGLSLRVSRGGEVG